jgi:hypothetical protein
MLPLVQASAWPSRYRPLPAHLCVSHGVPRHQHESQDLHAVKRLQLPATADMGGQRGVERSRQHAAQRGMLAGNMHPAHHSTRSPASAENLEDGDTVLLHALITEAQMASAPAGSHTHSLTLSKTPCVSLIKPTV